MPVETSDTRRHLLRAAATFVESVKAENGLLRIAVIGSILSDKRNPKDIDLLLTVTDGTNLDRLAAAGRRLKGTAQIKNLGADIFLVNEEGEYIGRTCGWKVCEIGIRMACRADHCGRRKYLNDDLSDLTLSQDTVTLPTLVLWPEPMCTKPVPKDVMEELLPAPYHPQNASKHRDA